MNSAVPEMMSPETAAFPAFILGIISLAGIVVGLIMWRKDDGWARIGLGAVGAVWFARAVFHWDSLEWLILMFLASWASGMLCFSLMRRRGIGFSSGASWIGGLANSMVPALLLLIWSLVRNDRSSVRESGLWFLFFVPAALLGAMIVIAVAHVVRLCARVVIPSAQEAETPAREQDRQMVLNMLRDGKVSGEQAADLLKALGPGTAPADGLPLTKSVVGAVGGGILVIVGFMLPWSYFEMPMLLGGAIQGYQAGYTVGHVGWIVLVAGILPALLICIPSLDKHVRQGLLRVVIACIGGALSISLLVRSPKGIGLWVAVAGFALQLFSAFRQAGLAGSPARR